MVELDKISQRLLSYIRKHPEIHIEDLKSEYGDCIDSSLELLQKEDLIYQPIYTLSHGHRVYQKYYSISAKGNAYYQHIVKNTIYKIYPLIISSISLIVSVVSLYLSCKAD